MKFRKCTAGTYETTDGQVVIERSEMTGYWLISLEADSGPFGTHEAFDTLREAKAYAPIMLQNEEV